MLDTNSIIFNTIAPIYAMFYNYQIKYYEKTLAITEKEIDLTKYKTILDIGSGTGSLCHVLYEHGLEVTGVDIAEKMIDISKEKLKNTNVEIFKVDADKKYPFPDNSFDIVISSYVVHGLKQDKRLKFYQEASRLAKEKVILHDYNKKRSLITNIVEFLEGGNYFDFIKVGEDEINRNFENVKIIDVYKRAAWYILDPYKKSE